MDIEELLPQLKVRDAVDRIEGRKEEEELEKRGKQIIPGFSVDRSRGIPKTKEDVSIFLDSPKVSKLISKKEKDDFLNRKDNKGIGNTRLSHKSISDRTNQFVGRKLLENYAEDEISTSVNKLEKGNFKRNNEVRDIVDAVRILKELEKPVRKTGFPAERKKSKVKSKTPTQKLRIAEKKLDACLKREKKK